MGLSGGVRFSRIVSREGLLSLLIARDVKVEVQAWVGTNSFPLKGKPPRSPLSTGLIPQSSYNFVPLRNQSYLLKKVPTQPTTLFSQAFRRVYSLGSLTTSLVQQCCLIAQFIFGRTYLFFRLPQLALGCKKLIPNHLKLILGRLQLSLASSKSFCAARSSSRTS